MIVTLTLNPAIDNTIELATKLQPGEVQSVSSSSEQAGGKGINVSKVLSATGLTTTAVFPAHRLDPLLRMVSEFGFTTKAVEISSYTRKNTTITDPIGNTTKLNELGPEITEAELAELFQEIVKQATGANWLVLSGSLPRGLAEDSYTELITCVRSELGDQAPKIALDTSKEPLVAAVTSGIGIDLLKPNEEELAQLLGIEISADPAPADLARYAAGLHELGVKEVLLTLGGEGAILASAEGVWFASAPRITPRSTVGAGDSSLAGFLVAKDKQLPPEEQLATAVAYGTAAARLPGTGTPGPAEVNLEEISVIKIK